MEPLYRTFQNKVGLKVDLKSVICEQKWIDFTEQEKCLTALWTGFSNRLIKK